METEQKAEGTPNLETGAPGVTPIVGKFYALRGGYFMRCVAVAEAPRTPPLKHFLRYSGAPSATFKFPQEDSGGPGGHYFSTTDVLREIRNTPEDRAMLERRRNEARARGLEAEAVGAEMILTELGEG